MCIKHTVLALLTIAALGHTTNSSDALAGKIGLHGKQDWVFATHYLYVLFKERTVYNTTKL